jgi:molybdenum cofactor cytidylyltransferase
MSQRSPAALILSAGESSRMGQDKALLLYQGRPFLEAIISNLRQAGVDRIAVVLGHHAAEIQRAVRLDSVQIVVNSDYHLGQTSSLQAGLKALDLMATDALLLCLVDHPAVSAEVMRQLLNAYRESGAPVVIPARKGRRGHPVLMGRALFEEFMQLKPNEGANTVIRKYFNSTHWLEVEDAAVLLDVDTPEDYRRLVGREAVGRRS